MPRQPLSYHEPQATVLGPPRRPPFRFRNVPPWAGLTHGARLAVLILSGVALAYFARSVLVPLLLAWVGSMLLNPPVRWLRQCHVPTRVAAGMVVGILVLGLGCAAYNLGRPAVEWAKSAPRNLPVLKKKFHKVLGPAGRFMAAISSLQELDPADGSSAEPQVAQIKDNHVPGSIFSWTTSLLVAVGETVGLLFLLLASGDRFMQKALELLPVLRGRAHAAQVTREIREHISGYLAAVGLVNVTFGTLVGLSLHLLGLPNAGMWGGVAAFLNFIPYFGPFVGMLGVTMAGLLAFDTLGRGLVPAGAYLLLHLVEANLVTPFFLGSRCALDPAVIFISLMVFAWLWGMSGALLALPLLVTAKVVCERIEGLSSLGKFLSG